MRQEDIGSSSNYLRLEEIVGLQCGSLDLILEPSDASPSAERRQSYRCPVQAEHQDALIVQQGGKGHISCRLVDRSAGGFYVTCSAPERFREGQILRLQSSVGQYEVEVVHVRRQGDETHLGLERICDIEKPDKRPEPDTEPAVTGSLTVGALLLIVVAVSLMYFVLTGRI